MRKSIKKSKIILKSIKKSNKKNKKYMATFINNNREKTIHFGAKGMSDYTIHKDKERKERYINRHKKRENWKSPMSAGALSRWILWNKPTLTASINDYKKRFSLKRKSGRKSGRKSRSGSRSRKKKSGRKRSRKFGQEKLKKIIKYSPDGKSILVEYKDNAYKFLPIDEINNIDIRLLRDKYIEDEIKKGRAQDNVKQNANNLFFNSPKKGKKITSYEKLLNNNEYNNDNEYKNDYDNDNYTYDTFIMK